MAGVSIAWLTVCLVVLTHTADVGFAQLATCYSTNNFSCSGSSNEMRSSGQVCCDEGFLSFMEAGRDVCELCSGNVICSANAGCTDLFDASQAQGRGECCATGGGVAYTDSAGICVQCPTSITGCFTENQCSGDTIPLTSTESAAAQVRECCVSTAGLSYNLLGQCIDCVVYGFLQTSLNETERGQGYPVGIGYIKRPPTVTALLRGDISVDAGGTATLNNDFFLSSTVFTARPNVPGEIIITYRVDSIAQEFAEMARLRLSLMFAPPPGSLVQDTLDLVIQDSDTVKFQLTETDYESIESILRINAAVSKNLRIANPVTFLLTPLTIDQAVSGGVALPASLPPDDNPFSPNRAKTSPEDCRDFSSDVISVRFESDEIGLQVSDVPVPVPITDDTINEAGEELFVVHLTLGESMNAGGVNIEREVSLCRITDNDVIQIGFQRATYNFPEPQFETEIFGEVFIEKQDGRITEQTFPVVFEVRMATPNPTIQTASLSTVVDGVVIDNDYVVDTPDRVFIVREFPPGEQTLEFSFTLFPDDFPEGTEAFQASAQPSEDPISPAFLAPSAGVLFASTFIIIEDDDDVALGFEQNYTVSEGVGSFQACFRVFNPPDNQELTLSLDLVVDTIEGSAGELDYTAIRSSNLDVFRTLDGPQRRACFDVSITDDLLPEDTETFSLSLSLDVFVDQAVRDQVAIEPSQVYVDILDNDFATVRFERPTYTFSEDSGTGDVCLIKDLATSDSVTVQVTTTDGTATDGLDYTGGPFDVTFTTAANDRQCITIGITPDTISETSESFTADIVITPGSGVTEGNTSTATITITDFGTLVNDSAIGDPLMTVPIRVSQADLGALGTDQVSLCYEIHGAADEYFNLVTDECISVNAHYAAFGSLNVISQIAVRAVDDNSLCKDILVDVVGCTASVGGAPLGATGQYMSNSISVRHYLNRVRISVPNCDELTVVMWVFCESRTMDDHTVPGGHVTADIIKFVVMRGLNFGHRYAHGLIGQFWNREVSVTPFIGVDRNNNLVPNRYVISLSSPTSGKVRSFTGYYYDLTWEFEDGPCLYAGNRQAGPIYEIQDPNDPVIEGRYMEYVVDSAFSESGYFYGLFNEDKCVN